MLIRHGEKPADPPLKPPPHGVTIEGRHNKHSLLPQGWQRAGALAAIFSNDLPEPLARPDAVFAPDYGEKTSFHRTTETVTPMAHRLHLAVQTPVPKGEEEQLVTEFLARTPGVLLVCWEHHHLPTLAHELAAFAGISDDDLPPVCRFWPEDDYWSVVVFTRKSRGGYSATVTSEAALEGDPPR